jgi:hypothetical protein
LPSGVILDEMAGEKGAEGVVDPVHILSVRLAH